MQIKRVDAILEVFTDRIVKKAKTCDKSLLWVSKQDISEFFVCKYSDYIVYSSHI